MASDKVREARRALAEALLEDIRKGSLNWARDWCRGTPHNPTTGKGYRGRNALLLMYAIRAGGYRDPRFITFNQAKKEGYHVRRGCHGWPIEKWRRMWFLIDDPDKRIKQPRTADEEAALAADPAYGQRMNCVGTFTVFNAEDVGGIAPYEGIRRTDPSMLADFLVKNPPCRVVEELGDRACYAPSKDVIRVPLRSQFSSDEGFARTLLHEMGHATGAPSRLGRDLSGTMSGDPESVERYAREELTAELASVFMANELTGSFPEIRGADESMDHLANSAAYLKGWADSTDNPEDEILRAATRAADASDWMFGHRFDAALAEELVIADVRRDIDEGRDLAPAVIRAAFEDLDREGVADAGALAHDWAGFPAGMGVDAVRQALGLAYPYGLDGLKSDCDEEARGAASEGTTEICDRVEGFSSAVYGSDRPFDEAREAAAIG